MGEYVGLRKGGLKLENLVLCRSISRIYELHVLVSISASVSLFLWVLVICRG
jgi:hypothetical protein